MAQLTPDKLFTIALIGGGIGGLTLARGLTKNNIPFHIYEAAPAFAEIGAGVSLSPNSRRAMQLIDPQIHDGFEACTTGNAAANRQDTWFEYRLGMDGRAPRNAHLKAGHKFTEVTAPGAGLASVHRAHFLDELIRLVPSEAASFGKRAVRTEDLGSGEGVRIHFDDGTTAAASAVIGCDGIKSTMRDCVLGPEFRARFSGKYAYRGLLSMDKAAELLGDDVARNSQMHCGYGGHVLTFPIEKGRTMNVVAFQSHDGPWKDERWVLPMDREGIERDFKDWGEDVKKILSLMQKPDVWALFEHPPADTFYKGRVCLMGDAAHASTPHQGAGAGMAVEDAYVLTALLSKVEKPEELEAAFCAYNHVRRQRDLDLVRTSSECGRMFDFHGEGVDDDLDKFSKNINQRLKWIWEEDLPGEMEEATKIFEGEIAKL